MNINKKELFEKVEGLVDQLVQLVGEYKLTEEKGYNDFLDLLTKMTLASGQTPIEKITHASALISILQLLMQGKGKVDQLANSGMKLSIGGGKMEISYDKPQEVVSIARETIIDLTSSNSKLSELTKPFESISSTMVVTKKEDGGIAVAVVSEPGMYEAKKRYSPSLESNSKISGFKQLFSDADSENSPEYQSALNNGGIFNKILTKSLDRIQAELDVVFDAVVVAMDRAAQTNDDSNVEVIILRGFVRDYWFNFIEVWRDKSVSYRAAHEVKIVRKVKFGDRKRIGYDYLINIPGFNLQPGDLIKFVII